MSDSMSLVLGGKRYAGWTDISIGRALDRCVSDFDIAVTEAFENTTRPILPFKPAQIFIGDEQVLNGYIDTYSPSLKAGEHNVRIAGRSATQDLVDCSPDVTGGQFAGQTVLAIIRAMCALFSIGVVVETTLANVVVPDATKHPPESAFEFIDRLATLTGALLTDDENGNLLVTTAGASKSTTVLRQGVNIKEMSATVTTKDRFSQYIVKGQAGLAAVLGAAGQTAPGGAVVVTDQEAIAADASVPRFRPKTFLSHSATAQAPLAVQAAWRRNYAIGKATRAEMTVVGWRQNDGSLWRVNQLVSVVAPALGIDDDLLVFGVAFKLGTSGHTTVLTLAPIQSAQPDPATLLTKQGKKGKGGSGTDWSGAGGIQ